MVLLALIGLPIALWLDLSALSDQNLRRQAQTMNTVISSVRSYYAKNVVGRVLTAHGVTSARHDYLDVPGAIPIPATLSIELGDAIGATQGDVEYRFVSDFPFRNRPKHLLTAFERDALARFRAGVDGDQMLIDRTGNLFDQQLSVATPVVMAGACVACHNSHTESAKTDWQVGDVRGVQTVTVRQPVSLSLWSFKWLLLYLTVSGTVGLLFCAVQFRLASGFARLNDELGANNTFLADISMKLSKYLSPQVYRSIFAGEKDVSISTERKKLTVFFSDIKDFTATTERLQPEELTGLLNDYFTEMSRIAENHGATIDKFIGDAIVAFFGDPTTAGAAADARACVQMALDMQARLKEMEAAWRAGGLEHPFQARMGINTGYCNVGNFGSEDRMDYTIIGAEANLAARMESIAEPGGIVMSYETYALVRDIVDAEPMEPVTFKGISRQVVPYRILPTVTQTARQPIEETPDGRRVTVTLDRLDDAGRARVMQALRDALGSSQSEPQDS